MANTSIITITLATICLFFLFISFLQSENARYYLPVCGALITNRLITNHRNEVVHMIPVFFIITLLLVLWIHYQKARTDRLRHPFSRPHQRYPVQKLAVFLKTGAVAGTVP